MNQIGPVIGPARPGLIKPDRLLILACSQRKHRSGQPELAIDYYDGPLWQTLRAVDPDGSHAQVAVLSALYGLRDARFERLLPYDMIMTATQAQAMIAGGITTRWPRPPRKSLPDTFGIHPAAEIFSMTRRTAHGTFTDVAIAGGHLYVDVATSWLPGLIAGGWISPDAPITVINQTIGRMRVALRHWLLAAPSRTTDPALQSSLTRAP